MSSDYTANNSTDSCFLYVIMDFVACLECLLAFSVIPGKLDSPAKGEQCGLLTDMTGYSYY